MTQCKYCRRTAVTTDSGDSLCRKHIDERIRVRGMGVAVVIVIAVIILISKCIGAV